MKRLFTLLLYPLFTLWLLVPWIRRYRRHPRWWIARLAGAVFGLILLAGNPLLRVAGASLLALAAVLPPVPDPDRVRRIGEALGAPHSLNAGFFRSGPLPVPTGLPLLFLLSSEQLLIVAADRPDHVLARHRLESVRRIRLEGEDYRPRYVSFAKEPPRSDPDPNHQACAYLAVDFEGATLELEFRGVFAAHLAEVAARTLYELRHSPLPVWTEPRG
jgi:hypothetical protein